MQIKKMIKNFLQRIQQQVICQEKVIKKPKKKRKKKKRKKKKKILQFCDDCKEDLNFGIKKISKEENKNEIKEEKKK